MRFKGSSASSTSPWIQLSDLFYAFSSIFLSGLQEFSEQVQFSTDRLLKRNEGQVLAQAPDCLLLHWARALCCSLRRVELMFTQKDYLWHKQCLVGSQEAGQWLLGQSLGTRFKNEPSSSRLLVILGFAQHGNLNSLLHFLFFFPPCVCVCVVTEMSQEPCSMGWVSACTMWIWTQPKLWCFTTMAQDNIYLLHNV